MSGQNSSRWPPRPSAWISSCALSHPSGRIAPSGSSANAGAFRPEDVRLYKRALSRPGALTAGDLCDVAAALAPRPLQLADVVDGQNRRVSADEATAALAAVREAYGTQADRRLSLLLSRLSLRAINALPPVKRVMASRLGEE